jgi:NTE family protein
MIKSKNKIGITFSGGGLSALAYAGFCEELQKHHVDIDLYAGLSGGALMAILVASKLTIEEITQFVLHLDTLTIINSKPSNIEIIDHRKFIELLREMLPYKTFEKLPTPVVLFATDLEKKIPVAIDSGDIASAIAASCSVFPLLQPVKRKGLILGDGGFTVYYGARFMRARGIDKVIGVDVTGMTEGRVKGFFRALFLQINSSTTSNSRYELELDPVDVDVKISFPSPNPLNIGRKTTHLIKLGQDICHKNITKIKSTLKE